MHNSPDNPRLPTRRNYELGLLLAAGWIHNGAGRWAEPGSDIWLPPLAALRLLNRRQLTPDQLLEQLGASPALLASARDRFKNPDLP